MTPATPRPTSPPPYGHTHPCIAALADMLGRPKAKGDLFIWDLGGGCEGTELRCGFLRADLLGVWFHRHGRTIDRVMPARNATDIAAVLAMVVAERARCVGAI